MQPSDLPIVPAKYIMCHNDNQKPSVCTLYYTDVRSKRRQYESANK